MTDIDKEPGYFAGLGKLLTSAAVTVALVLALFNSVFAELVPPTPSKGPLIGWVSLGAMVILLVLSVLVQRLRSRTAEIIVSALVLIFLSLSFVTYWTYSTDLRTFTFQVPPPPEQFRERHIRGELHEAGIKRLGTRSVDGYANADLDAVLNTDVLWPLKSRYEVIARLEVLYVIMTMTMIGAIFLSSLSLWGVLTRQPKSNPPKDLSSLP